MTPVDAEGRWYGDPQVDTANSGLASTVITAAGAGPAFNVTDIATIDAVVTASAVGGTTPSVTLVLQQSEDGVGWFAVGGAFTITANGTQEEVFEVESFKQCRWQWPTVTGTTPTATVAITTKIKKTGNA